MAIKSQFHKSEISLYIIAVLKVSKNTARVALVKGKFSTLLLQLAIGLVGVAFTLQKIYFMRNRGGWWVVVTIMVLLDLYVFQVVKSLASGATEKTKLIIYTIYWAISIACAGMMLLFPYINYETWPKSARSYIFATIVGLFFAKLVASLFFLVDDLRRGVMWLMAKIFSNLGPKFIDDDTNAISRSTFLSWLGLGLGGGLFATLVYGFSNKYNYQLRQVKLAFDTLPNSFKGLKIVHISDIHSGSFNDKKAVQHGVDQILKQKPDLILFTVLPRWLITWRCLAGFKHRWVYSVL